MVEDVHADYMRAALAEAAKCTPTPTAFCVGCVIVARRAVLATGFSRELPGNTHAEANALQKARELQPGPDGVTIDALLHEADVYTTMEPCSVRTSGLAPCADALVAAGVKRCIIGVGEPADFVVCEGADKLRKAGIELVWLKGLEDECLRAARRGHESEA
ncbi:cytidine deaminase-like protein [Auricularia subglabra TFB-10046 SS5]|nr:cytidine deaminase-like protein [Auricularia subglabra TFB-10046 SS5]